MFEVVIQHILFNEFLTNTSQDEAASRHHDGHVAVGGAGNRRAHPLRGGDQGRAGKVGRLAVMTCY